MALLSGLSKDSSFLLTLVHSPEKKEEEALDDNPEEIAMAIMRQRKKSKRG